MRLAVILLATLRLASGIAWIVPGVPVELPSIASLKDGSDATGCYFELQGDGGVPGVGDWGADGVLDVVADAGLSIERVEVVLRSKLETVLGVAGSGTVVAVVDQNPVGTPLALSHSAQDFTFDAPGTWTAALMNAARWGWMMDAITGDRLSIERGWVLEYAVRVYGARADMRTATLRAGAREA